MREDYPGDIYIVLIWFACMGLVYLGSRIWG